MLKKALLTAALAATLSFSLVGCGSKNSDSTTTEATTEAVTEEDTTVTDDTVVTSEVDGYWINTELGIGYHFENGTIEQRDGEDIETGMFSVDGSNLVIDDENVPFVLSDDTLTITTGMGDVAFTRATEEDFNNLAEVVITDED